MLRAPGHLDVPDMTGNPASSLGISQSFPLADFLLVYMQQVTQENNKSPSMPGAQQLRTSQENAIYRTLLHAQDPLEGMLPEEREFCVFCILSISGF